MLDIAIIGGGLCGLSLARELQQQGRSYAVFEARTRFGGRILSVGDSDSTTRADLGPTWFWPDTQPLITRLVAELGLAHFAQHDKGVVLALKYPDKPAEAAQIDGVHAGARRLEGGMTSLVEALLSRLPAGRLHAGHVLSTVQLRDDHVEMHFLNDDRVTPVLARRVVLAVPPRLVAEHISFDPPLDENLRETMHATPTWMAAHAKVVLVYGSAAWRTAGQAGNAFVRHEQAVLKEVFDACDATAGSAALGGFVALPPSLRRSFQVGLPMLMSNQMTQVFGGGLQEIGQHYQDWANERHSCSSRDLAEFSADPTHPDYSSPALRESHWQQRLFFGGSETAAYGGGYLEGALEASRRIVRALPAPAPTTDDAGVSVPGVGRGPATRPDINATSLSQFRLWVRARQLPVFEAYRQRINQSLAMQQREQLTQRAMLGAMEQLFSDALQQLALLPFDTRGLAVERGRSALTPQVQSVFQGFIQQLLDDVVAFNRTSCALSNFPDEHQLSKEYEQTILRDIAAAWREFSLDANALLLGKGRHAVPAPRSDHALRVVQ